jgi:hypothetical protein
MTRANYRYVRVPWTARNLERMARWLRLEYDFCGFILRDGVRIGHKQNVDCHHLCFVFYPAEQVPT